MLNFRKYSYVLIWAALFFTVGLLWLFAQPKQQTAPVLQSSPAPAVTASPSTAPTIKPVSSSEMAGLWVPFMSLTTEEKSQTAFEEYFKRIANLAKSKEINALFVHVRPYRDSLYPSALFPWSHILTGTQGQDPGYDPLAFMVSYTHELGMQFHAWINPLRIKSGQSAFELSADNLYSQLYADYPYYFMEYEGAIYLNPAYPVIRQKIAEGAAEIAANYEVDGIHFDDYFYPTQDGTMDADSYNSYAAAVEEPLSLASWRTGNINAMVAEVYQRIKAAKSSVVFGISPTGNIANNENMNADIKTWCAIPGYIDYICPQIYYSYSHPSLPYGDALAEWSALPKHPDLKMYIGLALYKAGTDADSGTWQASSDNIAKQIQDARAIKANGIILYSSDYLDTEQTQEEVKNAVAVLGQVQ